MTANRYATYMSTNRHGFSTPMIASAVVVVVLIGIIGWQVHENSLKHAASAVTVPTSIPSRTVSENGITVTSPSNGTVVSRIFSISGTAPPPTSQYSESIQVVVDHNSDWSLANIATPGTPHTVQSNGHFSIPIDLNGSMALEQSVPTANGSGLAFRPVNAGLHTFTINVIRTGASNTISNTPGPTLSLTIH